MIYIYLYIYIPGAPKTMKNKGFHLQKTWFLGTKTRFLMVLGALGIHYLFMFF